MNDISAGNKLCCSLRCVLLCCVMMSKCEALLREGTPLSRVIQAGSYTKNKVETPLVTNCSRGRGPKTYPIGTDTGRPEMVHLLTKAGSASAQAKAAAPQVGDRNWHWRTNILCSTIQVIGAPSLIPNIETVKDFASLRVTR